MEKAKTFTQFKEDIRKWKDAHREEYNRFARCMANGDERQYFEIFKAVALQSVKTARTMELCWGDDSAEDFEDVFISFKEDALPESIARLASEFQGIGFSEKNEDARQIGRKGILASLRRIFGRCKPEPTVKISAPLVLSWLFFGKSFEAMVLMTDKLVRNPHADALDKRKCSFAGKAIIRASINAGYRTKEDWDRFFSLEKAITDGTVSDWALKEIEHETQTSIETNPVVKTTQQIRTSGKQKAKELPLIDYLSCPDKEKVISVIGQFIKEHNTGIGLAIPYYVLKELDLFKGLNAVKEYSMGLAMQFRDIGNLKSESSCRQAVAFLQKEQYVSVNGKMGNAPLIKSDEVTSMMEQLRNNILSALEQDAPVLQPFMTE